MKMNKMIAVTNRQLYLQAAGKTDVEKKEDFFPGTEEWECYLKQVEQVILKKPEALVLREKDLPEEIYEKLALQVIKICRSHETECILHRFYSVSDHLSYRKIHLPLSILRTLPNREKYEKKGTSVHSVEDAREAEALGADYLFAGNIFETDCKKGLPGRGIEFLSQVCSAVKIPVYGIGGITPDKMESLLNAGAAGGCMMSGFLKNWP